MTDRQAKQKSMTRLIQARRKADEKLAATMLAVISAHTQVFDLTAQVPEELSFTMDMIYGIGSQFVRRR